MTVMTMFRISMLPLLCGAVIAFADPAAGATGDATLKNLQAAFNGESNAQARYLAFAKKADEEGFGSVGSLFRAAARAEEIHLQNHAAVIKKAGAEPHADVQTPKVGSTKDNLLKSASKGEAYERDTMYPRFITQAQKDGNEDAVKSFEYAKQAEAGHFELFSAAAHELKKDGARDYYVCTVSGYTMARLDAAQCPGGTYETVK